jgi:DNA-binding SARP family transcriptional activator
MLGADGDATVCLGPGKPLAVIAFLAFAPRHIASRESLCDLLWGDSDIEQSRPALRQTLWTLRRKTLAEFTEKNGDGVALQTPVATDAAEFALAVEAGELQSAIELYTGEFFAGFASPGASDFEKWVALQRSHFRSLFVHTAEALARRSLAAGRFTDVSKIARRLRVEDPFGEIGWRLSLERLTSTGELVLARAEADEFVEWLRVEERDPEPASAAAIRAARNLARSQSAAATDHDRAGDLVGREAEFSALQSLWEEARARGARRVHIVADPGLGKTRLVVDLCTRLRATRARVAYYRANPGERHIPFSSAAGLAAALATMPGASGIAAHSACALLALNPTLSSYFDGTPDDSHDDEALRRRSLALGDLVAAIADEAPLAVVIDDLHWCDPASKQLIAFLAARLSSERMLLVSTARPMLDASLLPDDTRTLTLRPLDREQIEQLIGSLGTLPAEDWSEAFVSLVAESSKGSPLLVLETIRACVEDGLLTREQDRWSCSDAPRLVARLEAGHFMKSRVRSLGDTERALLLVVATSGLPLSESIAVKALAVDLAAYESAKMSLESRGLVKSADGTLAVAHDEIAAVAIAGVTPEALRQAHGRLGAAMESNDSVEWRRRGIEHLAAAGNIDELVRVLPGAIMPQRGGNDSLDKQLTVLLGAHATPELIGATRARLPWRVRHARLPMMIGIAGIAIAAAAAAGAFAWTNGRSRELPEATLLIARSDSGNSVEIRRIDIGATYWRANQPIDASGIRSRERWRESPMSGPSRIGPQADGPWPTELVYPDSGELEVALSDRRGDRRRLTYSKGDDRPVGLSPDGKLLLIETTRWSADGHPSLAVLDQKTGQLRTRLTQMPWAIESNAEWEPGGERIGFIRDNRASGAQSLCLVNSDGTGERCLSVRGWSPDRLVGWLDETRVLVRAESAAVRNVLLLNLNSGAYEHTVVPGLGELQLDPSRRWIFQTVETAQGKVDWMVGPVDHFERAQRVLHDDNDSALAPMWWPVAAPTDYIDRVKIDRPSRDFAVGVPYALRLVSFSNAGGSIDVHVPRWRTIASSIATIDSVGVLVARDTGTVIIEGSAGGWRTVRDTIHIARRVSSLVFEEQWGGDVTKRWRFFGEPLPRIERDANGKQWFLNNGDGNFFSGAYLTIPLVTRDGIAVDVELSTPITRPQWQVTFVFIRSAAYLAALRTWDHRTGYLPRMGNPSDGCSFAYPTSEGPNAALASTPIGNMEIASHGVVAPLGNGRTFHLRIQILPDGRCGWAIDGHPLLIYPSNGISDAARMIALEGNSVDTRMLVGAIRVYSGVPTDIDWTSLRARVGEWRPGLPATRRGH